MNKYDISLDDLIAFAPIAFKLGSKKGYLTIKDNDNLESQTFYFVLVGNLLFQFKCDDSTSFHCFIFLESSNIKKIDNADNEEYGFVIYTIGGNIFHFVTLSEKICIDWIEAIECSKFISMTRKFDDYDTSSTKSTNIVTKLEERVKDLEFKFIIKRKECENSLNIIEDNGKIIKSLEGEIQSIKSQLKSVENERLLLLKSKGITPKVLPSWVKPDSTTDSSKYCEVVKIWVGTWCLSSNDPFTGIERSYAQRILRSYVIPGYDIYCVGVQDCVSDSVFECIKSLLSSEGYYNLPLEVEDPNTGVLHDLSKLYGGNDSTSLLWQKYTGIAVFVNRKHYSEVKLVSVNQESFAALNSKGAVAIVLSVYGRTVAFIASHFEHKKNDIRRSQYKQIITNLGEKLGESGFCLNEQFDHIFWFGNFNYTLVDCSGDILPIDTAIKMLEDNSNTSLFQLHDQLQHDKRNQLIFYGFREPTPFPNFYPTYKKFEGRSTLDYSQKTWVKQCYHTKYKVPFYKGGMVKEKTPSYCDRILYGSMIDLAEDLIPECVTQNLMVISSNNEVSNEANSVIASIDNYRSINDGEIFNCSDHSPVFGTFILRLQHDFNELRSNVSESIGEGKGNILDLLHALELNNDKSYEFDSSMTTEDTVSRDDAEESSHSTNYIVNTTLSSKSTYDLSSTSRFSLLPHGEYKFNISNLKLFWGSSEAYPVNVKSLFPAPYETVAGEKFVDFFTIRNNTDGSAYFSQSPVINVSPLNKSKSAKSLDSFGSIGSIDEVRWRKVGPSKTGTSLVLEYDAVNMGLSTDSSPRMSKKNISSIISNNVRLSSQTCIPTLQLVWKGDEPLDKLHIAIQQTSSTANIELVTGSCSISLEQLCKAVVSNRGNVNITRLLLKDGLPLYNIDTKTLQREQVTLCCLLELVS